MSFLWVIGLAILTLVTGLIGSGTNDAARIAAAVFFPSIVLLYFAPAIVASMRGHHNKMSIGLLNLFLGWTMLGWIAALIWAYGAIAKPEAEKTYEPAYKAPDADPEKKCPFCAETIKAAARKCKHCGSDLPAYP